MTCVISLLTDRYVMQISDRRLTARGRAFSAPLTLVDDDANKALFLDGRFSFAFTGLARFRQKTAEEWLATLWADDCEDRMDAGLRMQRCARSLTTEFLQIGWPPALKRLAYVGVGWIGNGTAKLKPAYLAITNFHGADGWKSNADPEFRVLHTLKPARPACWLGHAGVAIPDANWWPFSRRIRRLVEHNIHPTTVSLVILDFLQLVAANRPDVGSRAMVTCIPRNSVSAVPGGEILFLND